MIRSGSGITFFAVEPLAQHIFSTGCGGNPRPFNPGRAVAYMLEMAAG